MRNTTGVVMAANGDPRHHTGLGNPPVLVTVDTLEVCTKMDVPVTINPLSNNGIVDRCIYIILFEYPLLDFLVFAYMMLGVYYVTYGYRFFRSSMFVTGFTFAVAVVYAICITEELLSSYGNMIVATSAGLLFGLITMLIEFVGIFISGLHSGVLNGASGLALYTSTFVTNNPTEYWTSVLVIVVSGLTFACLNIYWKKGLTIVATSVYGGALIAMSLDYFLERWAMVKWVYDRVKLEPSVDPPCPFSWVILAVWPVAAILGILIQIFVTGNGIHHDEGLAALKRRSNAAPLTRDQRAELRQRKYRYLYQVRTAHGDVISQSYVQALQQKNNACEPWSAHAIGECSTLQSDSTHLTVLATDMPQPDSEEDIHQVRACH